MKLLFLVALGAVFSVTTFSATVKPSDLDLNDLLVVKENEVDQSMLPCDLDEWKCLSSPGKPCIKLSQVCDGVHNCARREDEDPALCSEMGCKGDLEYHKCKRRWSKMSCPKACGKKPRYCRPVKCVPGCRCPSEIPFMHDTIHCFKEFRKCPAPVSPVTAAPTPPAATTFTPVTVTRNPFTRPFTPFSPWTKTPWTAGPWTPRTKFTIPPDLTLPPDFTIPPTPWTLDPLDPLTRPGPDVLDNLKNTYMANAANALRTVNTNVLRNTLSSFGNSAASSSLLSNMFRGRKK